MKMLYENVFAKEGGEMMIDVVIDTDTYNEIDDQYALAYLINSGEKLNLQGIYAAPFSNRKCSTPGEGTEKSYEEIMRLLELMEKEEFKKIVKKGSDRYLPDECTPVCAEAAEDMIRLAMEHTSENPLYVIAIAAITDVASAILMRPEIIERIVVVWLGGQAHWWPENREFNLMQDIAAARYIFRCGVSLVQLPCMGVVSAFRVSGPELEYYLRGKNRLCDYLLDITVREAKEEDAGAVWSRAIWDVTAVAWLLDEGFMQDCLVHSPIPEYDHRYAFDLNNSLIRYVYYIDRDRLLPL